MAAVRILYHVPPHVKAQSALKNVLQMFGLACLDGKAIDDDAFLDLR
jgi:hypothetical protein